MQPLLRNKFVSFGAIGIVLLVALVVYWGIINLLATSTGLDDGGYYDTQMAPLGVSSNRAMMDTDNGYGLIAEESLYYPPTPTQGGYTSELEAYETTSYSVTARTKQFDEVCSALKTLKTDSGIHFKSLRESTNNCNAIFYVEEGRAESVLNTLTSYRGVEYTRDTSSVTRHRQQLQSQTSIIQQQLSNVQRSLTTAEAQLNNLNAIYLNSEDVATLSKRVTESLQLIDRLTERKISLTSQLNKLYQQSADLEARMGVVEFSVNISRSNPLYPNKDSEKWERAWDKLSVAYTDTLIGLSAFFGVFLLWTLRLMVYGIVLLIIARGVYWLVKLLWKKQ